MRDLTKGKPLKNILYFALPVLIGNLFNLAYNLADTRIIGSYLGNDALAAVGSVSTLNDLLIGFVVGLANGFAVVTAQYMGRGQRDRARKIFALSLEAGLAVTSVMVVLCLIGLPYILRVLNVMEVHEKTAGGYISIIIAGLLFSVIYNVLAASLRAVGDAYTPLIFLIVSAVLNVILDIIFVKPYALAADAGYEAPASDIVHQVRMAGAGYEMFASDVVYQARMAGAGYEAPASDATHQALMSGVRGAALATVVSQAVAALLCFIYTWKKYDFLHWKKGDFIPKKKYMNPMLASGFSMGLMSSFVALGTLALQTAINTLGTNTIVAHTAARKITSLYMLPFGVLGTTMATYCGQNYGAGDIGRIKAGLKTALGFSYIWCAVVLLASYTICPYLIVAVTDTKIDEVIDTACRYLRVDTLVYVLVPTINILRNSLQGMGEHIMPVISSSLELVGKVMVAVLLVPVIGYWGIIVAEPIVWAVMVIPLIISMVKRVKRL